MLCDVCKSKEATVYLTQIVDGKMQKVSLCEACSKDKGVTDPTGFALADLLLGMGAAQELERVPSQLRCSVCGFTQQDFKKTGRLGCSNCYNTFSEGLASLLKTMHKGTRHVGKAPANIRKTLLTNARLKSLREDLEKAVKAEQYERAASLRDQIRQIEKEVESDVDTGVNP